MSTPETPTGQQRGGGAWSPPRFRRLLAFHLAPLLLALLCCGIVGATLGDYGVGWDENIQSMAAIAHIRWFQQPTLDGLDIFWRINREHPPLSKVLDGATWWLFHEQLGWLGNIPAFRLGNVLFLFLLIYVLYRWTAELDGPPAGGAAVAAFLLIPQVFYHAHMGALDLPMAAMGLLAAYTFWKAVRDRRWVLPAALAQGLALLTKLNAFFLYIPMGLYWALSFRRELPAPFRRGPRRPRAAGRRPAPLYCLGAMLVGPPLVFLAGWPVLWKDTFRRTVEYLAFHLKHAALPVYYLGTTYEVAPWHYPWLMLLLTVPLPILLAIAAGLAASFAPAPRPGGATAPEQGSGWETRLYLLVNAFLPIALLSLPGVPRYDGLRLLLPALPFLALIAGRGVAWPAARLRARWRPLFWSGCLLLLGLTAYTAIVRPHPYQASYYNALAGGVDGAARLGLEPEYWGSPYQGLLPWLRQHPDETFWLYSAERDKYLYNGFGLYREDGLLDRPVRFGTRSDSAYVVLLNRPGFFDAAMWALYRTAEPVYAVRLSQTMLAGIYRLP